MSAGLQFNETMKGGFAFAATEFETGKKQGNALGNELAIHVTVDIDDIDRFIDDPNHLGGLSGTVDFYPLGMGIKAQSGVFNLFSPADKPEHKQMVYELSFIHQGKDYYLAGYKDVHDDPGFDLWSDTTTLFTRIYEGNDKKGSILGAGILTLGVSDLLSLLASMKVTHADSGLDKMSVIYKFGKFFMGELWDTYAGRVFQ